jgi:hypothetical protein
MLPKGVTFTHSDGSTYTTGKPGKPPKWLYEHPEYIKLLETTPSPIQKAITTVSDTALKVWKWADQTDDNGTTAKTAICIVAAHSRNQALQLLAKRFPSFPVYPSEFDLMWKRIDSNESITTPGVYEPNADKMLALKVA